MAFTWTAKRIQWYLDAARGSNFYETLAAKIAPYLRPQDTLCDMGCGLGLLDVQLAPLVRRAACLDVDETALYTLREEAAKAGVQNIETICADARNAQGMYDVVLMAFFGTPAELMLNCVKHATRLFVRVVNADTNGTMRPKGHRLPKETVRDVAGILERNGFRYTLLQDTFSFGQPLRSIQDARDFVTCNAPDLPPGEVDAFLAATLQQRNDGQFPFYLPGDKKLGIFVVEVER